MKLHALNPTFLTNACGCGLRFAKKELTCLALAFTLALVAAALGNQQPAFASQQVASGDSFVAATAQANRIAGSAESGFGLVAGGASTSSAAAAGNSKTASSALNESSSSGKKSPIGSTKQKMKVSARYGCYYISSTAIRKQVVTGYYPFTVKNEHGKVTFVNRSTSPSAKKIKVNSLTGTITVPKGFKAQYVTLRVGVKAKGDETYAAAIKYVRMKVRLTTNRRALAQTAVNEWWRGAKNGTFNKGGKRYWSMWFTNRVSWCSEFAAWCCIQSGLKPGINFPKKAASAAAILEYFKKHPKHGELKKVSLKADLQPGDLVIKFNKSNLPSHTGIVIRCSKGRLTVIEGNAAGTDSVIKRTYNLRTYNNWRYYIRLAS